MKEYKAMLFQLVTSKKFNTLLAAITGVLSQDAVPGMAALSEKSVLAIVGLVITYLYALGQEDKGKAAAKLDIGLE